jgi:predicted nucleic acid-binding protein
LSFEIDAILRRLKPAKRLKQLRRRANHSLPFITATPDLDEKYLLDTNIYINAGKDRLPIGVQGLLAGALLFHSPVAMAELAHALSALDPTHPESAGIAKFLRDALARIRVDRIVSPDPQAWASAALLSGILTRTHNLAKADRRKLLNDALLLFTARAYGLTLLTANAADFDLMTQIVTDAKVLFHR